ncbi:MAG TPA: HAD-IA family hydrolase [Ideonella sp.]|nr:HAD-IA family hydrolase [Ideonella sp.]
MLAALLWDVDGTLAETERDGHRIAFNRAFAAAGLPWHWDERRYGELLAVTGGRERLLHAMRDEPTAPTGDADRRALAESLHRLKNEHYAGLVAQAGIALREGVRELLDECAGAGVRLGIVTTTSRANVEALLGSQLGARWRERFEAVVCGEDAPRKKPDPQAYALALRSMALPPRDVLAIEDAPAGVAAARALGIAVIVTRSHYFAPARVDGVLAAGPSLGRGAGWEPAARGARIDLPQLARWHAAALSAPASTQRAATTPDRAATARR